MIIEVLARIDDWLNLYYDDDDGDDDDDGYS
jgi:hypothetical protein